MSVLAEMLADESGAITIDWVSLTAGVLLAGMATIFTIYGNGVGALVAEMSEHVNAFVEDGEAGDPQGANR